MKFGMSVTPGRLPMAVRVPIVTDPEEVTDERVPLGEHFFTLAVTSFMALCVGYAYGAMFGGG